MHPQHGAPARASAAGGPRAPRGGLSAANTGTGRGASRAPRAVPGGMASAGVASRGGGALRRRPEGVLRHAPQWLLDKRLQVDAPTIYFQLYRDPMHSACKHRCARSACVVRCPLQKKAKIWPAHIVWAYILISCGPQSRSISCDFAAGGWHFDLTCDGEPGTCTPLSLSDAGSTHRFFRTVLSGTGWSVQ